MTDDRHFIVALSGTDRDDVLVRYAALVARLSAGAQSNRGQRTEYRGQRAEKSPGPLSLVLCPVSSEAAERAVVLTAPSGVRFVQVPGAGNRLATGTPRPHLLTEVQARFHNWPEVLRARLDVLEGPMADGLLDAAAADGADSVLLGGEADRRLAGRLIHEAACSVWWVPDRPPTGIRRILVPVDYSTRAADSLRVATALARLSGAAECLALHVYFNDSPLADRRQDRVLRGQLAHSHARFLAGIDCLGVQVAARFQEAPDVARAIARTAEEEQADLIVMASRGRTRAGALLRESKAGRALDETRVPLLVVKHFGAQLGLFRVVREQVLGRANELRFN